MSNKSGGLLGGWGLGFILAFILGFVFSKNNHFTYGIDTIGFYFILSLAAWICLIPVAGIFLYWFWLGPLVNHFLYANIVGYYPTLATTLVYGYTLIIGVIASFVIILIIFGAIIALSSVR